MDYTHEQIEKLAKSCNSFNELVKQLYGKTDGNSWRKVKKLVAKLDIDTSHYKVAKYTKEMLEPVVKSHDSMRNVCKALGLKIGGGSQAFITRKVKEFGIDCSHFKKRGFSKRSKPKTWQEVLVKRTEGHRTTPSILRRCLAKLGREKCEAPNCIVAHNWLGMPITLQVHHIDGDGLNNTPKNLLLLCPNCHTQTSNWCNIRGYH